MTACPSENELLELVEGRASAEVRNHFLTCVTCQDVIGALSGGNALRTGAHVGRYEIRGTLGAGAMGIVHDAWDPELARPVALKLVRPGIDSSATIDELHARLKREAQAMARLADPHVVAVYDVGRLGEQVFVAMEQVSGGTLTAWLRSAPRTTEEILARLLEAGRGLSAAHAAGLVHRDFKPDNVLIGTDGRARVTDFGLAQLAGSVSPATGALRNAHLTRTGVAVGTPIYMAPEQLAGKPFDTRADVFAFCVTVFEALTGTRPWSVSTFDQLSDARASGIDTRLEKKLPRAIRAVVRRGLALEPSDRWPSIDACLRALDPAPRRRRVAALSFAAGAVALLGITGLAARGERVDCSHAGDAWGETWTEATKQKLSSAFAATGVPFAPNVFARVAEKLDRRAEAWRALRVQACTQTQLEHSVPVATFEERTRCLDARRRQTGALVELLSSPDAELVESAEGVLTALDPIEDCESPRPALALSESERAIVNEADAQNERARLLRKTGRYELGWDEIEKSVTALEKTAARDRLGAALVTRGLLQEERMKYDDAFTTYERVVTLGLELHDDRLLADALMQMSGIDAYRRERLGEAHRWLDFAQATLTAQSDVKRRAKMWERRSMLQWIEGDPLSADRTYAKFLALEAGLSEADAPKFFDQHGGGAYDMGHYDIALGLFTREEAKLLANYGPHHPELLEASENKAEILALIGRSEEAVPILRDLLARFPDRAAGYTNHRLGEALRRGGHFKEALEEDEKAITAAASDDPGLTSWAQPLTGKGLDLIELGRAKEAVSLLERAAALRMKSKLTAPRGEAHFGLARALWDSGGDRARARELATLAASEYREADRLFGSKWFAAEADAIDRWLAEHRT
ncbi:MAG: protein kinase [Archangium sp.]